jgi:hypothetical protein
MEKEQHNHADGEECNPGCDYGNKKDNGQFKLEETQAPKTLPQELGTRAGNLGDVSGSANIQDIMDEYKEFEELCNEMHIDFKDDVFNKEHMDSGNLYAFYSEVINKHKRKVLDVLDNGLSDDWFNSEIWGDDLDDNEVIEKARDEYKKQLGPI